MEEKDSFKRLERIVKEFNESKMEITPDTDFELDLGMDSLDLYEFSFFVENEFEISIPDYEVFKLRTPKDYVKYIEKHQKQK